MPSPPLLRDESATRSDWRSIIALRLKRHLLLKILSVSAYTWVFFIGYFSLLREPASAPLLMPLTALDRWIPFQPWMLVPYFSLWFYVGLAPGMLLRFVDLVSYGFWAALLCITGLALFYFFPTAIPPLVIDPQGFPGFTVLQGVDAAGNACPSMHVAFAMFSAIWVDVLLADSRAPMALRAINALWFVSIAWSTVAIRQHVVLDAAAGAALGLMFAMLSLAFRPERLLRALRARSTKAHEASAIIARIGQ